MSSEIAREILLETNRRLKDFFRRLDREFLRDLILARRTRHPLLLQILKDEKIEITINMNRESSLGVISSGIKNYRQAGSKIDTSGRERVEIINTLLPDEAYGRLDPDAKPKYAGLRPASGTGFTAPDRLSWYGKDFWTLKLRSVRDRTTWRPGDSWSATHHYGHQVIAPDAIPRNWTELFIPWRDRALMIPFLIGHAESDQSFVPTLSPDGRYQFSRGQQIERLVAPPAGSGDDYYIELQVWGRSRLKTSAHSLSLIGSRRRNSLKSCVSMESRFGISDRTGLMSSQHGHVSTQLREVSIGRKGKNKKSFQLKAREDF